MDQVAPLPATTNTEPDGDVSLSTKQRPIAGQLIPWSNGGFEADEMRRTCHVAPLEFVEATSRPE
jgi:hypothetical protein